MNKTPLKILGVAGGVLAILSACGGSNTQAGYVPTAAVQQPAPTAAPTLPAPAATATARPAPTPTAAPAVAPTATTAPASTPAPANDPLAKGKLIFEKTAGGLGCAFCHGMDAKGNGPAQVNAPDIRSKTEADLRAAIQGGVPMMAIVKLNDEELAAVIEYIHSLP